VTVPPSERPAGPICGRPITGGTRKFYAELFGWQAEEPSAPSCASVRTWKETSGSKLVPFETDLDSYDGPC
jgi:hypothetical protein